MGAGFALLAAAVAVGLRLWLAQPLQAAHVVLPAAGHATAAERLVLPSAAAAGACCCRRWLALTQQLLSCSRLQLAAVPCLGAVESACCPALRQL